MRPCIIAVLSALLLGACVTQPAGIIVDRGEADITSATVGDVQLSWRFEDALVHFEIGAPTSGWVGIAIDPVSGRGKGAIAEAGIVAGFVTEDGVTVRDDYGCESYAHCPDTALGGSDGVVFASGTESPGWTRISFAVPRSAVEPLDFSVQPGSTHEVILGYGRLDRLEDNWFARHRISITF